MAKLFRLDSLMWVRVPPPRLPQKLYRLQADILVERTEQIMDSKQYGKLISEQNGIIRIYGATQLIIDCDMEFDILTNKELSAFLEIALRLYDRMCTVNKQISEMTKKDKE